MLRSIIQRLGTFFSVMLFVGLITSGCNIENPLNAGEGSAFDPDTLTNLVDELENVSDLADSLGVADLANTLTNE